MRISDWSSDVCSSDLIAQTFFATAAAFAGLSLFGYTTKRNLSAIGTFLIMGVVGLLVAMVINLFLQSNAMAFTISAIGVLLFAGLTAHDTRKIKSMYFTIQGSDILGKSAVMRSEEHTSELQSLMRISYAV